MTKSWYHVFRPHVPTTWKAPGTFMLCIVGIFLFAQTSLQAQDYKPAIEYASLMNMRFYEGSGGFYVDDLQLVFPPKTAQPIWLVIMTESGKVVTSMELARENWTQFPMFDGLRAKGDGMMPVGAPGKYNLAVTVGKAPVTILPFTLRVTSNNDPFNPQKTYTRDGMWNVLGYLSRETDKQDAPLHFNWWSNLREFGVTKGTVSCTARLKQGDRIIAEAPKVVVSSVNWQFFSRKLVQPRDLGGKNLTLSLLTSQEGEYRLVLTADGKPAKTYRVVVRKGELQRLPFCSLTYKPHAYFMSPRMIDTSSGSASSYRMLDAYWVQAVKE